MAAAAALWFGSCAAAPELAGVQWQECRSPTMASLRGLCPLSAMVALASGSGGVVLRTLDGGASWEPIGPRGAGTLDFRSLAAPDPQHLAVASAGSPARIYASDDGGGHWQLAHEDAREAAFFDTLVIDATGRGFALGDPLGERFVLLFTRDFGASWRAVETAPPARAGEAAFAASNGCLDLPSPAGVCVVTGGAASRALVSTDDGAHWSATPLPLLHGQPSQGAFAVAFADPLHGVVVGGDYADAAAPGAAAFTDDGGASWQAAQIAPSGYRSGVAAISADTFLAVGPAGSSISRDGGRSWQAFGELGFHTVRVAADGAVWAAGSGGRIARLR